MKDKLKLPIIGSVLLTCVAAGPAHAMTRTTTDSPNPDKPTVEFPYDHSEDVLIAIHELDLTTKEIRYIQTAASIPVFTTDRVPSPPSTTTTVPVTTTTIVTVPAPTSHPEPKNYSVWDNLAGCESGGEWSYGPHSGWGSGIYHGGLQFHPNTWLSYGGAEFAQYAYQASREQQIIIAERVQASQGWRAWPDCSRSLGLR